MVQSAVEETIDAEPMIRRYLDGDEAAFDELVEHTKRGAYALAYRWTRNQENAFDIVQEAYIKLFKFLPKWDYTCRVQTWLYRVVTNICIDKHRRQRLQLVPLDEARETNELANIENDNPRQALQAREWRTLLEAGIRELPRRMQEAVRLRYAGGMTIKEIAEIQKSSVGTIKATLHQATRKLQSRLGNL